MQCKKYTGRVSKPQALKEIIKFALFTVLDPTLLPNSNDFEYKFFISSDLTEPAIKLIYSYKTEIEFEITDGSIVKYIGDICDEYESFTTFRSTPPINDVLRIVRAITPTISNSIDISNRLYSNEKLLNNFFSLRTVVSTEDADRLLRAALDDYGVKLLTDQDLKNLQQRISATTTNQRVNLGLVDFFGFDVDFFRFIKGNELKTILELATKLKSTLDVKIIEFIQEKIGAAVIKRITLPLLMQGKIHPFSVNFASPYLFNRLMPVIISANLPKELNSKFYPDLYLTKEAQVNQIAEKLFATSEKILRNDYSDLVGDSETVALKIKLYEQVHSGFTTIQQIRQRFALDIELLKPVLDNIETEISLLFCKTRTVSIKDGSFFADEQELNMILSSLKAIDG